MNGRQLDKLLKAKIRRAHWAKLVRYLAVFALCASLLAGLGAGAYFAGRQVVGQLSSLSFSRPATPPEPAPEPAPEPKPEDAAQQLTAEAVEHTLQLVWFAGPDVSLPETLSIRVLHAGEHVISLPLRADSGWCYTWQDAYSAADLSLHGEFPQEVSAAFSISGENFTVTAAYAVPEPKPEPEPEPEPEPIPEPEPLPATGVSWWQAVVLALLGVCFLRAGKRCGGQESA